MTVVCMPVVLLIPTLATRFGLRKSVGPQIYSALHVYSIAYDRKSVLHCLGMPASCIVDSLCGDNPVPLAESIIRTRHTGPAIQRALAASLSCSCPKVLRNLVRPQRTHSRDYGHHCRCVCHDFTLIKLTVPLANPVGGAIAQVVSSRFASVRQSVRNSVS